MFLHSVATYLPQVEVPTSHFASILGRDEDALYALTGIRSRRRADSGENSNSMAVMAARASLRRRGRLDQPDLIVGATYTPWDTVHTVAHAVQRDLLIRGARAFTVDAACTSFLTALEVASAYLRSGLARDALLVAVEHNSGFASDDDPSAGHLWGDGAAAAMLSPRQPPGGGCWELLAIETAGLGDLGKAPDAVWLRPTAGGLTMPLGRDVFEYAVRSMVDISMRLLASIALRADELAAVVPHQANARITAAVARRLGVDDSRVARTLERLGNTGCASVPIALADVEEQMVHGATVLLVAFGGGYSVGGAVLRFKRGYSDAVRAEVS